jgi:hypothetical protein
LVVRRGQGYLATTLAEKVDQAIRQTGEKTQDAVREGAQVTKEELQRLQMNQDLHAAQARLASISAEVRELERGGQTPQVQQQLRQLRGQEAEWSRYVRELQDRLDPVGAAARAQAAVHERRSSLAWLWVLLAVIVGIVLLGCCVLAGFLALVPAY